MRICRRFLITIAYCAGCFISRMIKGRMCITVTAKYIPKDCSFPVDRKFYFCALQNCLNKKHTLNITLCYNIFLVYFTHPRYQGFFPLSN